VGFGGRASHRLRVARLRHRATAVYHLIASTRGKCVPTDFLGGVKPKMWLSDRLAAQLGHAEEHQFCLAHLTRDAQYAIAVFS
jgi:transposase